MNVSSLTPWLSDFHTVRFFCQFWLFLVFKFAVVFLLFVRGGTVCLPPPPSWLEVVASLITKKKSKLFTDGEYIKQCLESMADIICPEKKGDISKISFVSPDYSQAN